VNSNGHRSIAAAIWFAGGAALCGFVLVAWFFFWAAQHDAGDGVDEPYPLVAVHSTLGGLVIVSLIVAWARRRSGRFRIVHIFPLLVAAGYAGMVLFFSLKSLFAH